jgi:hypothetical protein
MIETVFTVLSWIVTALILYVIGLLIWSIGAGFMKNIFK